MARKKSIPDAWWQREQARNRRRLEERRAYQVASNATESSGSSNRANLTPVRPRTPDTPIHKALNELEPSPSHVIHDGDKKEPRHDTTPQRRGKAPGNTDDVLNSAIVEDVDDNSSALSSVDEAVLKYPPEYKSEHNQRRSKLFFSVFVVYDWLNSCYHCSQKSMRSSMISRARDVTR